MEKENQEKEEGVIVQFKKGYISMQLGVDAIVNDANAELTVGKGISMEIHHGAGPQLYEECKSLAPLKTGQAVITKGYELPNAYVIHTLGPVYAKEKNPAEKLALCYKNCLRRAEEKKLSSIAFGTISVETSGYPLKEAAEIALQATCEESINLKYLKTMFFVFNDSKTKDIYYDTFYRRLEETRREDHEKFLKEEPDIELSEEIKNLSPWKRERFYEFTKKFLIKSESEPYRKEPDSPYGGYLIPWMKATVYFYCDNKKSQIEQDEECREIESFIGHLVDSGVGILVHRAIYCWHDTSNGKIYRLQKECDGFVDVVGNFEYSLNDVSENGLKKYFSIHPKCDGRRGFTIELIVSDLRFFMKKFDEYIQTEKAQKQENADIQSPEAKRKEKIDNRLPFPKPDATLGLTWQNISMNLDDSRNITIKFAGKRYQCSYISLGFADTTKKNIPPSKLWDVFTSLFYIDGFLMKPEKLTYRRTKKYSLEMDDEEDKQSILEEIDGNNNNEEIYDEIKRPKDNLYALKKLNNKKELVRTYKYRIAKKLKDLFQLNDDPFENFEEGYQLKIKTTTYS